MAPFTSLSWLDSSVLVHTCETRRTRTRYVKNWFSWTECFSHTQPEFTVNGKEQLPRAQRALL